MTSRRMVRGAVALVAVVALLNLVGVVADRVTGGGVVPGPDGSSHVTTGAGWAAYHDLLVVAGHPVTMLTQPVRSGVLDPGATLVIASPDEFVLDERQVEVIARFVDGGGRLVLASTTFFGDLATNLLESPPRLGPAPEAAALALVPVAETSGVTTVRVSGLYAWEDTGSALPIVGGESSAVAAVASIGDGRIVLLADPAILSNALIGQEDNAAFGLGIVGGAGRPVVFNEYVHGYGGRSAWGALSSKWRVALLLGFGAALVWLWSIGSRFAPAEPSDRVFPPARGLYIDALAASVARSPDHPER